MNFLQTEMLKSRPSLDRDNKPYNASLRIFDLPTLIEKIKHSHAGKNGGLNAVRLVKSHDKQIVLTRLL